MKFEDHNTLKSMKTTDFIESFLRDFCVVSLVYADAKPLATPTTFLL